MRKKLKFRDGTTILAHADLISFLHRYDTRILYMPYVTSTWQELQNLNGTEEWSLSLLHDCLYRRIPVIQLTGLFLI